MKTNSTIKKMLLAIMIIALSSLAVHAQVTLNLELYIQGYYTGAGTMSPVLFNAGVSADPTDVDSINVSLVDPASLVTVGTKKGLLKSNGLCMVTFPSVAAGSYYLSVTHQNSIETWSANPVTLSGANSFDFTTANTQAFGNNMIQVEPGVWALYNGDINQDCFIDALDLAILNVAISNAVFGYDPSDVNGDGFVDINDFPIVDANNQNFIACTNPGQVTLPPCSGTPAPGNTFASSTIVCSGEIVTLSLQNNPLQSGLTYQWQESSDGITYTDISGATNATLTTPIEIPWEYKTCKVTCTNSGMIATANPIHITLNSPSNCGCTGMPTPGNTLSSSNPVCANDTITLSLQNQMVGSGVTYQWQESSDGITYTDISGATNATLTTPIEIPWEYKTCKVTCTNSGMIATANPIHITLNSPSNCGCTGMPTPGNTLSSSNPVCANDTITLSLQNPMVGSGVTYQWQESSDGITYTDISGATNATLTTPIEIPWEYKTCKVTCTNSGMIATANPIHITLNSPSNCGCTGMPTPGNTLSSSNPVCANDTITLSLQNPMVGSGVTYQWQESSDGITYTDISGATNATLTTPIEIPWEYKTCKVTCTNSGMIATANPIHITLNSPSNCGCTGMPTPGNTLSSSNPVCANDTITLSLQNQMVGSGVTYQWQESSDGITYTDISGATNATLTTPIEIPWEYKTCKVTCTNSGMIATANPIHITLNSPSNCGCTGMPTPGNTLSSSNPVCANDTITLSLQNPMVGSGVTYQWQESSDGITYTDISGATNATLTTPIEIPWEYKTCKVTCTNSGMIATANPIHITLNSPSNCGCTGMPTPGNTLSSSNPVCANDTITLSLQNPMVGSGVTYQWQESSDGITYTDISGATNATLSGPIEIPWEYKTCRVTCSNSGMSASSNPVSLTIRPTIIITDSIIGVTCNAGNTASVTVTASGGAAPFTYLWDNGSTNVSLTGLAHGEYAVTVTDNNGCTATHYPYVSTGTGIIITDSIICVTAPGGNDGSVILTATNGTTPYQYSINGGAYQASNVFTNLSEGTYSVNATDANGCSSSSTISVTSNTPLNVSDPNNPVVYVSNVMMDAIESWSATTGVALDSFLLSSIGVSPIDVTKFMVDFTTGLYPLAPCRCRPVRTEYSYESATPFGAAEFDDNTIERDDRKFNGSPVSEPFAQERSVKIKIINLCIDPQNLSAICCPQTLRVKARMDVHLKSKVDIKERQFYTLPSSATASASYATELSLANNIPPVLATNSNSVMRSISGNSGSPLEHVVSGNLVNTGDGSYNNTFTMNSNQLFTFTLKTNYISNVSATGRHYLAQSIISSDYLLAFEIDQNNNANCCLKKSADWAMAVRGLSPPKSSTQLKTELSSFLNTYGPWVSPVSPYLPISTAPANLADKGLVNGTVNCPVTVNVKNVRNACYNSPYNGCITIDGYGGTPLPGMYNPNDPACINTHYNCYITSAPACYTGSLGPFCTPHQFCGLCAGNYTVQVTDFWGNTSTQVVTVGTAAPLTINSAVTNADCNGNNGTITVNASGGTGAFSYSVDGVNQKANLFTNLGAGIHSITVYDWNGCATNSTATIAGDPICDIYCDHYDINNQPGWFSVANGNPVTPACGNPVSVCSSVNFMNVEGNTDHRVHHAIPTLPNSWVAEFEFRPTGGPVNPINGVAASLFCLTAGTKTPYRVTPTGAFSDQDFIEVNILSTLGQSYLTSTTVQAAYQDGKGAATVNPVNSQGISIPLYNNTYYARLERINGSQVLLSVFTNAARTTHLNGSPVSMCIPASASVTGLNTLQHANINQAGATRRFSGTVDNACIKNGPNTTCPFNTDFAFTQGTYCISSTIGGVSNAPTTNAGIGATWVNDWIFYETDANCNEINLNNTLSFFGNSFSVALSNPFFKPGRHYVLKHGIYSDCQNWCDTRKCFSISPLGVLGTITGVAKACPGENATYTVAPLAGAVAYFWNLPLGASILSGHGTNTISVGFDQAFNGGTLSVTADNGCGITLPRTKQLSRNIPGVPFIITGESFGVCNSFQLYSVPAVAGCTYLWTIPVGCTLYGIPNIDGNAVYIYFDPSFVTGIVSVQAVNACGISAKRTKAVSAYPKQIGNVTGLTIACTGQTGVSYSFTPIPTATSYFWSTSAGATIASGQGSNTATVNFSSTPGNRTIYVRAQNACGNGSTKAIPVTVNMCRLTADDFIDKTGLSLYPNPAHDELNIKYTLAEEEKYTLQIIDVIGRTVITETGIGSGNELHKVLDVRSLTKGMYMVQLSTPQGTSQMKVIVE